MRKGEIIYCSRYNFPDGGQDNKIIINLNDPAPGESYLLLLTTSQSRSKLKKEGCHSNLGYYVISKTIDFFDRDWTWVLFWTLREFSLKEELRESWGRNFITKGFLKDDTLRAIVNCLKNSNFATSYQISLLK